MEPQLRCEIDQIKKELDQSKRAIAKWHTLVQKREELIEEISIIPEGTSYKNKKNSLIGHLRELDHLLDHLEGYSPEKIEILETQLLEKLFIVHPELKTEFDLLQQSLKKEEMNFNNFEFVYKISIVIKDLLKGILETRQKIRRWGILSYIFGMNPNQLITQYMHAISEHISVILQWVKENKVEVDPALNSFFFSLQEECQKRWGFRKIDIFFKEAYSELSSLIQSMEEKMNVLEGGKLKKKEEMENWILRQSGD